MNTVASIWSWSLPTPGFTTVEVFDVQGRRVRTLYSGNLSSGFNEIAWDFQDDGGGRVARGVYFYRFKAPGVSGVRKIQVTR